MTFTNFSSVALWACGEGLVAVLFVVVVQPAIDEEAITRKRTTIGSYWFQFHTLMQVVISGLTIPILHDAFQAVTNDVLRYPVNGEHPGAILSKRETC